MYRPGEFQHRRGSSPRMLNMNLRSPRIPSPHFQQFQPYYGQNDNYSNTTPNKSFDGPVHKRFATPRFGDPSNHSFNESPVFRRPSPRFSSSPYAPPYSHFGSGGARTSTPHQYRGSPRFRSMQVTKLIMSRI